MCQAQNAGARNSSAQARLTIVPTMGSIDPIMGSILRSRIGEALYGRTRQAVLRLLFARPDRRFLQSDVIGYVASGTGAVQRELERLSKAEILLRTREGRQIYYQANPATPIFEELRGLVRKTFGLAQVLQDALAPLASRIDLAFVFGSVASGTEKSSSDVDLLVVSNAVTLSDLIPAIRDAEHELGREVNPSIYSTQDFHDKLRHGQHFLTNVMGSPKLFLIGNDDDIRRLATIRVAQAAQRESGRNRRTPGHSRS